MESNKEEEDISFLPKPEIDTKNLTYITGSKDVYVNLFQIKLKKNLVTYAYNFSVEPQIEKDDPHIRMKIFSEAARKIKSIYGEYYLSPDTLYSLKKITEIKTVKINVYFKGNIEYTITINPCREEIVIKEEDIQKTQLAVQILDLLIKDILHANPNLEFFKGYFVFKEQKMNLETDRVSIDFYPGYAINFLQIESGNYLCVSLKNKYLSTNSILDYLETKNLKDKNTQNEIKKYLIGKTFKVNYSKHHYKIDDILFDQNPNTQTIPYDSRTVTLTNYYKLAHQKVITDLTQPIIVVHKKGPQEQKFNLFFIPELSYLTGLDDTVTKDNQFMRMLSEHTKLSPEIRIQKMNEFLTLFKDERKKKEDSLSSKEKSEYYGIEIQPLNHLFKAYYMEEPILLAGNNTKIDLRAKQFKLYKKEDLNPWLCFYTKSNYSDAEKLFNHLQRASKAFGLTVEEPEWVEMNDHSSPNELIETAEEYLTSNNQ